MPNDILAGLNAPQKEAVQHISGPLLILAGPGSGKTRVITHRVAYLIQVVGVKPGRIMAVTFTNKAAREMTARLETLLGGPTAGRLALGTFHALCARFLRQEGAAIGVDPHFVIHDDEDTNTLIKQSLKDLNLDPKQYAPQNLKNAISAAKNQLHTPAEFAARAGNYFEEVVRRVYERYQQRLEANRGLDFDDLLMKTVRLFSAKPEVIAKYQDRYVHVMVDEFQDTNTAQYRLVRQLAGKYRNLCVVGDPDQSIYSWRFADIGNILSFEKDFPDAKVVLLEQNYRSTGAILNLASKVIAPNTKRVRATSLWTENAGGESVTLTRTFDEQAEASFVLNEIQKLVDAGAARFRDCAVMYRVNAQSRSLEENFLRYGIPHRLVGGVRFYQRREIKDLIAYLRLVQNPDDNLSLSRIINVPGRGIGDRTISDLNAWASTQGISISAALLRLAAGEPGPFKARTLAALTAFARLIADVSANKDETTLPALLDRIIRDTGYQEHIMADDDEEAEERWENVLELQSVTREYLEFTPADALATFLDQVSLVADVDELKEDSDAVTLITLHQAKGLEFPVVFITGLEEGLLPHRRSMESTAEIEEERRLFYVGVTRAKQRLFLTTAFRRSLFGGNIGNPPSRFLKDLPPGLLAGQAAREDTEAPEGPRVPYSPSEPPLPPPPVKRVAAGTIASGDRVRHAKFGEGVVIMVTRSGQDHEISVAFSDKTVGVKRLLLSLAPLEKLEKGGGEGA
jgi:DNA helicase-2/ATP-dependent DNA helicase PcrA